MYYEVSREPVLIVLTSEPGNPYCEVSAYDKCKQPIETPEIHGFQYRSVLARNLLALRTVVANIDNPSRLTVISNDADTIAALCSRGKVTAMGDCPSDAKKLELDIRSLYRHKHRVNAYITSKNPEQFIATWEPYARYM